MVQGERWGETPKGKLESNPPITDLSYSAWAEMGQTYLC